MTALLFREKPAHAGLVDVHGRPLSDRKTEAIVGAGYGVERALIDLAKGMDPRAKHTIVYPKPGRLLFWGTEIDVWHGYSPEEKRRRIHDAAQEMRAEYERTGVRIIAGGAAGAWTATNNTRTYCLNGTFDWDTDSFKIALFLSTSGIGAASTTYAGVTNEHANANGYTTGGIAQVISLSGTTTVTAAASASPTWTASGGSIVARFAVLYEVSGNVGWYCLLDSTPADVTTTTGNTFTIATTASIFTAA